MEISPPVRIAAVGLMGLFVVGLTWRSVGAYQADKRAQRAAAVEQVQPVQTPVTVKASAGEKPSGAEGQATPPPPPPAKQKLQVHVEGAVRQPGVYTLEAGARVHEAIAAAGGALEEGLPGALNLAAPLTDGSKLYVYTRAELQQPAAPPSPTARAVTYAPVTTTATAPKAKESGPVIVNINSAAAPELERVPGIGPTTAQAIIQHRTKNGPFRRVEDLTAISGIGPKTLERLRPYLTI